MTYSEIEVNGKEVLAKQLTMEATEVSIWIRVWLKIWGLIPLGQWKLLLNWKKNLILKFRMRPFMRPRRLRISWIILPLRKRVSKNYGCQIFC